MSYISTNSSARQKDVHCPLPCVCSLAHFLLYCFVTLLNFKCICPSVSPRARAEKRSPNTRPHTTVLESGSRCSPICAFLSLLSSVLSFPLYLSLIFLTAITFVPCFCFSFSCLGSKKKNTEKEKLREKERKCRVGF